MNRNRSVSTCFSLHATSYFPVFKIYFFKLNLNIDLIRSFVDGDGVLLSPFLSTYIPFSLHLLNEALLLSYLYGDLDYAQRLVDKHSGKGTPLLDKNGNWLRKEKFTDTKAIGVHLDINGKEVETDAGMIVYSKTGTHIYPRRSNKYENNKGFRRKKSKNYRY